MNTKMNFSMTDERILITGSARRVGRAIALAAASAGADVVIHFGASMPEAESLAQEIRQMGRRADVLSADLDDPQAVDALFQQALAGGAVTALVNNASIFEPLGWNETTLEIWQRTLAINLTAPFLLSQAFARALPSEKTGRILNLLDWRALRPGSDHLAYTISKAGLAALTQSLAAALAPRITVNGLALGAILPPSNGSAAETARALQNVPAARWSTLEELQQAALFLLAGPAFITGEIIHLDGGRHLV